MIIISIVKIAIFLGNWKQISNFLFFFDAQLTKEAGYPYLMPKGLPVVSGPFTRSWWNGGFWMDVLGFF
jgi:hypothetical protein